MVFLIGGVFGVVGAIVGGLLGGIFGSSVNEQEVYENSTKYLK